MGVLPTIVMVRMSAMRIWLPVIALGFLALAPSLSANDAAIQVEGGSAKCLHGEEKHISMDA